MFNKDGLKYKCFEISFIIILQFPSGAHKHTHTQTKDTKISFERERKSKIYQTVAHKSTAFRVKMRF